MKKKLALLGFGNAGKAFTRLLLEKLDIIREEYASDVIVTAVSTRSRGSLVSAKFHLRTYQRTPSCPKTEERYHSVRGRDIFSSAPLSFPLQ